MYIEFSGEELIELQKQIENSTIPYSGIRLIKEIIWYYCYISDDECKDLNNEFEKLLAPEVVKTIAIIDEFKSIKEIDQIWEGEQIWQGMTNSTLIKDEIFDKIVEIIKGNKND